MAEQFLSRDAFLSHAGKLAEETLTIDGFGTVICRELSGKSRALVLGVLAPAVQEGGKADLATYQEMLLELGLVDPDSPADDRRPLLDLASRSKAMEIGAAIIEKICSTIERLSGLDKRAPESAEKNSAAQASSDSTSE